MTATTFNQLCNEVEPISEIEYLGEGEYEGAITGVTRDEYQGTPQWKLKFSCAEGSTFYTIWGFTPFDFEQACTNPEKMEKVRKSIAITKRLMLDLGLPKPTTWNDGALSIVSMIPDLVGKKCRAIVSKKEGKKYPDVYLKKSLISSNVVPPAGQTSDPLQNLRF